MNIYCKNVLENLEKSIDELRMEIDEPIFFYETAVGMIIGKLRELKAHVIQKGFSGQEEEILFFKNLKPLIVSKLIYYHTIYKIETKKPFGGRRVLKKYLNNELSELKVFFDKNLEFYRYYRTNSTYLDHKYFVREECDIKLSLDTNYFESDYEFSTSHDYRVAKIMANDLLQVYLEDQIINFRKNSTPSANTRGLYNPGLNWTASKAAMIELIYALHAQAVFENGNVDIKVIAKSFEAIFNIDLGDFYHTYLEIRNRKTNRTKFLDFLRESLLKKMDESDERY